MLVGVSVVGGIVGGGHGEGGHSLVLGGAGLLLLSRSSGCGVACWLGCVSQLPAVSKYVVERLHPNSRHVVGCALLCCASSHLQALDACCRSLTGPAAAEMVPGLAALVRRGEDGVCGGGVTEGRVGA